MPGPVLLTIRKKDKLGVTVTNFKIPSDQVFKSRQGWPSFVEVL